MTVRSTFQEALDGLRISVDVLGELAEQAVVGAAGALFADDPARAAAVIAGDDRIDALFVSLEERAYALIAQQAPVATDLRFLMSALRVMADFEKTGDRAVALAKIATADWRREPVTLGLLGRMADLAVELLRDARQAWLDADLGTAAGLKRRDDTLDECYRRLTAHLLAQQTPDANVLVLHGHAAGRNLERIADHAVMIGERVSYLLTGDPSALAAEIG